MQIRPVGADGQRHRQDTTNSHFLNFAKAPKKSIAKKKAVNILLSHDSYFEVQQELKRMISSIQVSYFIN